jgi:hypothetical protein
MRAGMATACTYYYCFPVRLLTLLIRIAPDSLSAVGAAACRQESVWPLPYSKALLQLCTAEVSSAEQG